MTPETPNRTNLHRGEVLEWAVKLTGLNKEDVAERAGYKRPSYYVHIKDANLPYHILTAYGKAIKYDFTTEFPEMPKYLVEDPLEIYGRPITLEQAMVQINLWKDKYMDLLERYNRLIEEKMNENRK